MDRLTFIGSRVLQGTYALLAVAVINFLLIRAAPGDPASVLAGDAGAADEIYLEQLRSQFGLDKPIWEQLATYIWHVVRLDLGYSYRRQAPVIDLILERLPATLLLTVSAFVFSLALGIIIGSIASRKPGGWIDRIVGLFALMLYSAPIFWLAIMAVLLFSIQLGWFPAFGYSTVGANYTGMAAALDVAYHLVLPTLALSSFYVALYARMTRASMIEVSYQAYIKTARSKGLNSGRIRRAHILRNAMLPVVTLAGLQAGNMVGGAVLTETVFAWPGIGRLMFEALVQRDYNLLLGTFLFTAATAIAFNIITDVVYTTIDPRIRL